MTAVQAVAERNCIVCGAGSHRAVWLNTQGEYVACDGHSKDEVAGAVKLVEAAKQTAATQQPKAMPQAKTPPAPPAAQTASSTGGQVPEPPKV